MCRWVYGNKGGKMKANLESYKVFYYVGKYESFTLAAKELAISQPAVSQAMKQLENILEVKLFTRGSKGIRMTKEGQILYEYIQKGYEQMELGEQMISRLTYLDAGELRIGASDMTLHYFLLPYLELFHEKHPGIRVYISNAPTPETLDNLQAGQIDFAVVTTPFAEDDAFETMSVREIEDIFVAGHRYMHLKNHMTDFSQLRDYPIISLEKNTSTRRYIDELLQKDEVILNPEFELSTSDMIVQFALRNLGIGCVVKDFALPYIESGKLFALRFNKMIPKREICIVTDKKMPRSIAAQKILELIQKEHK